MKVVLFDADGVLTVPGELFSHVYARSHGLNVEPFERFFKGIFQTAILGKTDLKDLILKHEDIWHCDDPNALVKQWLESEDVRNEEALKVINQLRKAGVKCYLATNQEKYRGAYMRKVMFKDMFDDYFISSEMGVKKPDRVYFECIIAKIQDDDPTVKPKDIIFIDDTKSHVDGAKETGIDARLYEGTDQIKSLL